MSKAHAASSLFIGMSKVSNSSDVSNALSQIMELSKSTKPDLHTESIKQIAIDSNVNADILQQALENSGLATNSPLDASRPCVRVVADSATGTLRRHIMRDIGGVKWYQCVYCTKEFKKPSDLVRHIRIHTHEKPYKCNQCYRAFAVKSTLNAHVRTHSGTKNFSCEHCKKLFSTSGSLKVHLLLHTGARPFACEICGKSFRTSGHRNTHQVTHGKEKQAKRTRKNTKSLKASDLNIPDITEAITLQEPILITDEGLVQPVPKTCNFYNELAAEKYPPDRPYGCIICHKAFKKSSHLKQHVRSHTGEKPYKCLQCDRSFVSNGVLKAHAKTHGGVKTFTCNQCTAAFTTNGSLKRHMCIHTNDRPYMCPYCQKTFKTSMNCKKHMNTHRYELAIGMASGGVAVTVVQDGVQNQDATEKVNSNVSNNIGRAVESGLILSEASTQTIIEFSDSFRSDPGENLSNEEILTEVPQQLTQEVYNTQTGMIEQVEVVTQTEEEIEQVQNNVFLNMSDISESNLALQPETTNEEFSIPINSEVVPEQIALLQHNNEKPVEENSAVTKPKESKKRVKVLKKPFQCEQCSKVFRKSSHLKQHIFSHTGEKKFRCGTCGDMFSLAKVLRQHIKAKHEHCKDFKCPVCTAAFAAKSSLIRHLTLHDESQPFHCAYCLNRYSTKEQYTQHLKELHPDAFNEEEPAVQVNSEPAQIQIPEQSEVALSLTSIDAVLLQAVTEKDQGAREFLPKHPHLCSQCSKSFKKPSDLVRHMRIHTGEKPYKCDDCGKAFTVKSTLDSHQKTHTGEKNFSCHICLTLFATRGSLKVHMRLHTGAKPFKCPHCELHFRTSGHRKSHVASHFKQSSGRKQKKSRLTEAQVYGIVNDTNPPIQPVFPVVSVAEEVVNVATGVQVPNGNQTTIQLQPSNLVNTNLQLIDPSLMTKTIQIDASVWQQLQQHLNFNITIDPSLANTMNGKNITDLNQPQILNVDGVSAPTVQGAFAINPNMIFHQLGFAINPQQHTELQPTENVTLIIPENISKGNCEEYQTSELFDSRVLSLETNALSETEIMIPQKSSEHEVFINNSIVTTFAENSSVKEINETVHSCEICDKVFKTNVQLKRHSKIHSEKPKIIYHCQTCNKDFKKNNQFQKHLQSHK